MLPRSGRPAWRVSGTRYGNSKPQVRYGRRELDVLADCLSRSGAVYQVSAADVVVCAAGELERRCERARGVVDQPLGVGVSDVRGKLGSSCVESLHDPGYSSSLPAVKKFFVDS